MTIMRAIPHVLPRSRSAGLSNHHADGRLAGPNKLNISYGDPVEGRVASGRGAHGNRSPHRRACVQRLSVARRMAAGTGISHVLALLRPSMPLARSFAGGGAGEGSALSQTCNRDSPKGTPSQSTESSVSEILCSSHKLRRPWKGRK